MTPEVRPHPRAFAAAANARYRQDVRVVEADRFATIQQRVREGLEWAVGGLIVDDGRILLVYEDGRWLLPGGEVERRETLEEALTREVREETGLTVSAGRLLSVTAQTVRHGSHQVGFTFAIYRAPPVNPVTHGGWAPAETGVDAVAWHERLPSTTLDRPLVEELLTE